MASFAIFLVFTHDIRTGRRAAEHWRCDSRGVDEYPPTHAKSVVLMIDFNSARLGDGGLALVGLEIGVLSRLPEKVLSACSLRSFEPHRCD